MQRLHRPRARGVFTAVAARFRPSPEQVRVLKGLWPYVWPSDRPDLQAANIGNAGQRPAAGADRMDIDDRKRQRERP